MIREMLKPEDQTVSPGWVRRLGSRPGTYLLLLAAALAFGIAMLPSSFGRLTFGLDVPTRRDLGSALIGGAVIGIALLGAERALGAQLTDLELQRAKQSAKQALRLQLSLVKDLAVVDLRNADLRGFYLPRRNLRGAMLFGADLSRAHLRAADLAGSSLWHATLDATNLAGAVLTDAELIHAHGVAADMTSATMRQTKLNSARLPGADLNGSDLSNAWLVDTDLTCADLSNAVVDGARFINVQLKGANVSGVDLSTVASWKGVTIDDVISSNATIWPDGIERPPSQLVLQFKAAPLLGEPPLLRDANPREELFELLRAIRRRRGTR